MDESTKYNTLKKIIKVYLPEDVAVDAISLDSNLITELNINSAHLVDIVLDVEDEFDILLENEDIEKMKTVQDALTIIDTKLEAK
ncbi:acyl carrier protein [Zobellia alginiliquefaciens]|uniref:acyl carrier protein n=1 Tax=Zobellia alginiliquefaciens TaxID=3032586 RepID=UPI0023E3B908|nr:phosphopantetheine-binding protein [Zobellia alginiliquefaciens]